MYGREQREQWRAWYHRLKENTEKYNEYINRKKQYQKKYYEKKKLLKNSEVIGRADKMNNDDDKKKYKQESTQQVVQEVQLDDWQKQMLIYDIAWTKYSLLNNVCFVDKDSFNEKLKLSHQLGLDNAIARKLRSILSIQV